MSIVVVGSVALDSVTNIHGKIEEGLGGSAVYFSLAASLFTPVSLVAVVGRDFPDNFRALLADRKVDLTGLSVVPGATFRWVGEYTPDLNRAITLDTQLNVFKDFKPDLPVEYRTAPTLFLANIDPVLQLEVLNQMAKPRLVGLDTMNFWIERQREDLMKVLRRTTILFINEDEAKMLSGKSMMLDCARAILDCGPETVVIKRGAAGVSLFQKGNMFSAPVYSAARVIDTTGAGDSFAAGFMGYLTREDNYSWEHLKRAAICGTITASFNIESFSIHRLHGLRTDEFSGRWREFAAMTSYTTTPDPL